MDRRVLRRGTIAAGIAVLAFLDMGSVAAGGVSVTARNYVFVPSSATVHVGDTVVWAISGDGHTITSGTVDAGGVGHASGGPLASGFKAAGQTYAHTFTQVGTFPYFCEVHADSQMKGTITVVAAVATPKPTPRPTPHPTPRPTPRPSTASTPAPTTAATPSAAVTAPSAAVTAPSAGASETVEATPTPSAPPSLVAVLPPAPPSLGDQLTGKTSSSGDPPLGAASAPFLALGVLIVVALAGAGLWLLRRRGRAGA